MAPTALSWMTPPRLACDLVALGKQLRHDGLEAAQRARLGVWFGHMLALGFVSETELSEALQPNQCLPRLIELYGKSCARWVHALNRLVCEHACGPADEYEKSLDVSLDLWYPHESRDLILTLTFTGYCLFSISSLHSEPPALAALVYEALELIAGCLVPCLMPAIMWDGSEIGWQSEEYEDEYRRLCKAGALEDLEAGLKLIRSEPFEHFTELPLELAPQLEAARLQFDGHPDWMRIPECMDMVRSARRLQTAAESYQSTHGHHRWAAYVKDVCTVFRARFPTDPALKRYQEVLKSAYLSCDDNEAPLAYGLWVSSGSDVEVDNAERLFQSMGESGEEPTRHFPLSALASERLGQILDNTAIGLGLLLRAHAINHQILERVADHERIQPTGHPTGPSQLARAEGSASADCA